MTRLGNFNKEKGKFNKRTKHTTNPFSELNREAIAYVYDELVKLLDNRELSDKEIETLLNNGSFSKIYSYSINKINSIKVDSNNLDGIWKKYNQGSNPEILFNDINGKGTGWCTAGSIQMAEEHLNGGDFYVYFTKDDKDNYTIPRLAIRTDYGSIAEIRGISEDQNIEEGFEEVIDKKLDEFPDKKEYKKQY